MPAREQEQQARAGFTLLETLVAMSLFAIGVLALAQVQFAAGRSNLASRLTSTASLLASDRLEECVHAPKFDVITPQNYSSESYGAVEGGAPRYKNFRRTVNIVDTTDITGRVSMKTVTVQVAWRSLHGEREVQLVSRVARY